MDDTATAGQGGHIQPLNVINPGWTRHGASDLATQMPGPALDPWGIIGWWESPWQAKIGIRMLTRREFLRVSRPDGKWFVVPSRVLYPYAIQSTQDGRIERAAYAIAAMTRQAREMYAAAATVSDLTRPLVYFYGALALAKAVVTAVCGVEGLEDSHGLNMGSEAGAPRGEPDWRVIEWKPSGQFPMLYRAARWDDLYRCCHRDSRWQGKRVLPGGERLRFHALECIRALDYEWGTLPDTGFTSPAANPFAIRARQALLLPYRSAADRYMTRQTPLSTPLIQPPRVAVQYMLLYYFSMLARYRPVEWQGLLAADRNPEGYVFRVAAERVAEDFVHEVARLLPNTPGPWAYAPIEWTETRPALDDYYRPPEELVDGPQGPRIPKFEPTEWQGIPSDTCAKAEAIASGERQGTGA